MTEIARALAALEVLERHYDGPIPEPLRQAVRFGSTAHRLLTEAEGQAEFFASLIADQIETIRGASQIRSAPRRLFTDLTLYCQQERWWRREAWRLGALTPRAGDAP